MRIKEGMKARFEAIFAGNPRPNIIWLFNGEEIQGRMESQLSSMQTQSLLYLEVARIIPSSKWSCRVTQPLKSSVASRITPMIAGRALKPNLCI